MDIDIDFVNRDVALNLFRHVRASRVDKGKLVKHNTGVYLQHVPFDPVNNLCATPYNDNNEYFKIDFLNVGLYNGVKSEEHLIKLMNEEPVWSLLEEDDFTNNLFHVNGHGILLRQLKPTSIEQLAAVLAIIRPAKRHLVGKSWNEIMQEVWAPTLDGTYAFKKSHGHAYAIAVVVQMNLLCEQLI